jgi:hypothetical protein
VTKIFEQREGLMVYFEKEDLDRLRAHAQKRCMMLGPWIRQVILQVAAKQGTPSPQANKDNR